MQDTIFIENIPTQAVIGIHSFEQAAPQPLIISVELGTDITTAAQHDEVQYALDYDAISHFIDTYVQASRYQLLEALAENLCAALFAEFAIQSILLSIQKPGAITYTRQVGVKIYRNRD